MPWPASPGAAAAATRIDLTWTDNASNETGFKIDVPKFSNFSTILDTKTAAANATSLSVTNLDPNTTYYFRVRATNGAGDSSNSASANDTTDNVTATYLSDLNWTSATSPYLSARKDKSANNTTLSIGSTTYAKGVGVHSTSELIYDLDGAYDTFEAYVGIDDNVGNGSGDGSAQWLVYVDNTLVYTSPRRTGADGPYFISVDITGCDTLKLVTNTGGNPGDNDYKDHANWADAKLLSTGGGMLARRGTQDGKQQQSQQQSKQEQPSQQYGLLGSGGGTEVREHNAQNQITEVDEQLLTYDANGNLTTDEDGNILIYDAWNRLVKVEDANEATIGEYEYDALMRRVEEDGKKLFHSANWQVIEERNAGGDTTEQYAWSPVYVDSMVAKDRDTNPGTSGLEERLYVQQDENFNVTSVSDDQGAVVERYVYDPYGERTILDENWEELPGNASAYDFRHGHQGGKHNDATGLMHFRNREYSTSLMRWAQQDPMGYVDGMNGYGALANNPIAVLDPSGTINEYVTQIWDDTNGRWVDLWMTPDGRPSVTSTYDPYAGMASNLATLGQGFANFAQSVQNTVFGMYNLSVAINPGAYLAEKISGRSRFLSSPQWAEGICANEYGHHDFNMKMMDFSLALVSTAVSLARAEAAMRAAGQAARMAQGGTTGLLTANGVAGGNTSYPTSRLDLHMDLRSKGFTYQGTSKGGYVTYKGPNGRTITVKPSGEIIPTQRVPKADGSGKFSQRQDYSGNPLAGQSHSTGHFTEPLP